MTKHDVEEITILDTIDVRDIIARIEFLEEERDAFAAEKPDSPESVEHQAWSETTEGGEEYDKLIALMGDLSGAGGDEKWRGDWYPMLLIRDSYFQAYAEQLADDIGAIDRNASWPTNCIDWERAARELQSDYTPVEFDGVTYWTR